MLITDHREFSRYVYSVNIVTPDNREDVGCLIEFVEESDTPVFASIAYGYVKDAYDANVLLARGNDTFKFWFSDSESAKSFASYYNAEMILDA